MKRPTQWQPYEIFGPEVIQDYRHEPAPCILATVYEAVGPIQLMKVSGGWQKFEGKWNLGFGPKQFIYRPISEVKRRKRDFEECISCAARKRHRAS